MISTQAAGLRLASLENRARRPTPCGNRDVRCVVRVPLGDGRHHNAEVVLALEAWRLDEGAAIFAELRDLARRGAGPRGNRAGEPGRRGRTSEHRRRWGRSLDESSALVACSKGPGPNPSTAFRRTPGTAGADARFPIRARAHAAERRVVGRLSNSEEDVAVDTLVSLSMGSTAASRGRDEFREIPGGNTMNRRDRRAS